ncbi:MAG: hypothetical protein AAFX51_13145 [Cyanobacteria bacterium J06636_28]
MGHEIFTNFIGDRANVASQLGDTSGIGSPQITKGYSQAKPMASQTKGPTRHYWVGPLGKTYSICQVSQCNGCP